ncbi:MAG: cation:proton antiporter [Alphaproteobacteria bacterium]|nr:cation:proton antiporter [Alphaproteobacteria bacterium]MBU2378114.1 cation:proton antiporter [Alphaproteobacteria bacterium]
MEISPYILFLLGLGAVVLLVSWAPKGLKQLPLSLAMLCVALGWGVFSLGILSFNPDPRTYDTLAERLTELVVIIALMGAGLKLDRPLGLRAWGATWRLLAIAMPLTIAATAVLGLTGLGFSLAMSLLLGAAMAPTDPVLASDVQTGPPRSGEENEVRFNLTAEAGLNDALAFPFVNLAILVSLSGAAGLALNDLGPWFAVDVVWKLAAGGAMGWIVGKAMGWLIFRAHDRGISRHADGLVAIGATFIAYALTELVHGYGFLAVFVCALTIRASERDDDFHEEMHDFAEQIERLLMMLLLVLFGGALANGLLDALTWADALIGLAILFIVRPVVGYLSLIGSPLRKRDRIMLAYLGIRGLGSVYYLAYGINHGTFGDSERLWAITGFIVLVSIVVHGVTSTPLMALIERLGGRDEPALQGAAAPANPPKQEQLG